MECLLGRATLAIHGGSGDALREAGAQDRVAGDVCALFPGLADAAHDHVVHEGRIGLGASDNVIEDLAGEIRGVPILEATVATASSGAACRNDICFSHEGSPLKQHSWGVGDV